MTVGSKLHQSSLEGVDTLRSYVNSFEVSEEETQDREEPSSIEIDNPSNENSNNEVIETPKYDDNLNENEDAQDKISEPKKKRFKKDRNLSGLLDSVIDDDSQAVSENGNHMEGRKTRSSSRWSSKR